MKKLSFIIAVLSIAISGQAQTSVAKLGVSNIFTKTINLEYEYVLNENSSVLGEFGYQLPINVPQSVFDRIESLGSQNNLQFNSGQLSGLYVAGEYRFYVKGNAPQGFYVSPYVKLGNRDFEISGDYSNNILNNSVSAAANLSVFSLNIGGQIGYQFVINDQITINWNIVGFGLGLNRISGDFTANDNGVFDSFAADAQTFVDDIPFLNKIDLVPDNVNKTISAGSPLFPSPATRISVSIGYMF